MAFKQQNLKEMSTMQRSSKTNQVLVRGRSNLLVERILSIVVFKIDVFFVWLKEEIPNNSISEIWESLPLKIFSSMLRMLLRKIDRSSEKIDQWWRQWTVVSMSLPQQQIGFKQSRKLCLNLWSLRWLKPKPCN